MCITLSLRLKEGRGHYCLTCNVYHPSLRLEEGGGHYCLSCTVYHPKSKAEGRQGALLSQCNVYHPSLRLEEGRGHYCLNCNVYHLSLRLEEGRGHYCLTCNVYADNKTPPYAVCTMITAYLATCASVWWETTCWPQIGSRVHLLLWTPALPWSRTMHIFVPFIYMTKLTTKNKHQ